MKSVLVLIGLLGGLAWQTSPSDLAPLRSAITLVRLLRQCRWAPAGGPAKQRVVREGRRAEALPKPPRLLSRLIPGGLALGFTRASTTYKVGACPARRLALVALRSLASRPAQGQARASPLQVDCGVSLGPGPA